jgi:DNA-directed RNA polymerase subunit RPC12/RpoP
MGRMKEIFMAQMEEKYQGSHDAYIQDMARVSVEEWISDDERSKRDPNKFRKPSYNDIEVGIKYVCPNCFAHSRLHSTINNETEVECLDCGQEFVIVDKNTLRFK